MSGQVVYLVLRKDSLDRNQVMMGFHSERDADVYVSDCKKKDDRYGLSTMKYEYYIHQTLIQHSTISA